MFAYTPKTTPATHPLVLCVPNSNAPSELAHVYLIKSTQKPGDRYRYRYW